jgi:hypothetical protein
MPPTVRTATAITPEMVDSLVATACRAPSVHNSQPWLFRLDAGVLELRADPARVMRISDPTARELVISCGAALYNLRLALRNRGLRPHVHLAPDSHDPLLLARVSGQPGPEPTSYEVRLLAATIRRHTHRHGFDGTPLDSELLTQLAADVAAEHAELLWVSDSEQLSATVDLTLLADRDQAASPAWKEEIRDWLDTTGSRRDGMPIRAVSSVPPQRGRADRLPVRSFAVTSEAAVISRQEKAGRVAVLLTDGDGLSNWLDAGQALQSMLLRAADTWVFATYATAALELPHLRASLQEVLNVSAFPQMVLELGHAACAHATPRLPAADRLNP